MKFICTHENLRRGLNQVSHLAGRNQNLPILNNVLLETKGGTMILSTTNLEIGIKAHIRGKTEVEGSITVPAKLLNDFIQNTKSEKVELSAKDNVLQVVTPTSQTTIKGLDYSEFPLIPEIEKKETIRIKTSAFREALGLVLFAVALDNTRPEISGVLFKINPELLVLVATDSYRLAEKKVEASYDGKETKKMIIPAQTLQELNRILSDIAPDSEFVIHLNENQILFEADSVSMVSRITEGEYPDYEQVIPQAAQTTVELDRGQFQQAVKAASLFCRQGINDISLVINEKHLEIKALNDQVGESQNIVEAKVTGDDNMIVFNYHYLLDVLGSLGAPTIVLKMVNNSLPGVINAQGKDDYTYIIMPIKQ